MDPQSTVKVIALVLLLIIIGIISLLKYLAVF